MRFFLKIKQNGKQIALKRIEAKQQLQTTDQLFALIQKSLNLDPTNFIVRLIKDVNTFRIIQGWPLNQYQIRSGLQLDVQILPTARSSMSTSVYASGGDLVGQPGQPNHVGHVGITPQVQFGKQQMGNIIQQDEEGQKTLEVSHIVQKKYEQLLKMIQRNNTALYMKQIRADDPHLGACQNEYYKKQLLSIQNELGTRGWAAIHCAIFADNQEIVNFLIEIGVDINNKTSDEWLPIQLAVRQENLKMIDILVAQPFLNVNICTAHGLVLIMAVQSMNKEIVAKILEKDINLTARDHLGRNVYDVLGSDPDPQIFDLVKGIERRQSLTTVFGQKSIMYHTLISSYHGQLILTKSPPFKNKEYYISVNPYQGSLKIFESKSHYPQFPKQIVPLSLITNFRQLKKSQRSWYLKSDLFYLLISTTRIRYVFACHFQNTLNRWIQAYQLCREHIAKYQESIKLLQRNQMVIGDLVQDMEGETGRDKQKKGAVGSLMSLFTTRFSESSDSPAKRQVQKCPQSEVKKSDKTQCSQHKAQPKDNKDNSNRIQLTKPIPEGTVNSEIPTISNSIKTGVKFEDFKILKTLGEGAFGTVFLALDLRNPEKKKLYALKCFKKKKLVINKQIKYTIAELNILKQLNHPFIINLHFTFQTPNYVYLGLDYCSNKDLSHHLMGQVTFPEKQAMFYTAEILLALEYLHQKNIIYRDLKPENIMLDQQGHIKLVDFGLSKQGSDRDFVAKSFCGSPAYLSPEMLIKKGVGRESDYYCLGAVLYEMLVGEPPFFSDDIVTLYHNISNSKLVFPKSMSNDAKSILIGLLERDPQKRLGSKGIDQIKNHSFFREIQWQSLIKKTAKTPIREQDQQKKEKQSQIDFLTVQSNHKDFDYTAQNQKINRFLNFSFIRESTGE